MRFTLALFGGLAVCSFSIATIHHVYPEGSIQEAVYLAQDGDTVLIHDGEYRETTVLYGKCLTIGSEFLLDCDTTHIAATIISPQPRPDTASVLVYSYYEPPGGALCGLTLRDGRGTRWHLGDTTAGGAVYLDYANLDVSYCRFLNCRAYFGGGMAELASANWGVARLRVHHCDFIGCVAEYSGGGIWARGCSLSVNNSHFYEDTAFGSSAGIRVTISVADIDSCEFRRCAGLYGAVWYLTNIGRISNCLFEENRALGQTGANDLQYDSNYGDVVRCVFRNNATPHNSVVVGQAGIALNFYGNVLEGNTATISSGTLQVINLTFGDIGYCLFRNNTNSSGGAIWTMGSAHPRIHHNWFEGNRSLDPTDASVVVSISRARPLLDSNVVINNLGQTIGCILGEEVPIDARNNWWGDISGPYHPTRNPAGRGDTILQDLVEFIPWLTEPPDTTMPPMYARERTAPEISHTWELFELYPNPFNSSFRIILAGFTGHDFAITLHNLLGQQVDTIHHGALTGGVLSYQAPPSMASGVYFVRAADRSRVVTKKVVLLR